MFIHPYQPPPYAEFVPLQLHPFTSSFAPVIIKMAARVYWLQRHVNMDHNKLLAQYIYTFGYYLIALQLKGQERLATPPTAHSRRSVGEGDVEEVREGDGDGERAMESYCREKKGRVRERR